MRVSVGQQAPHFITKDVLGFKIVLDDYIDQKILLNFNRYAGCPFCNSYFLQLLHHATEYQEKGLQIISFFQSPQERVFETATTRKVPFPIIADPQREIYDLYGVESSLTGAAKSLREVPTFLKIALAEHIYQGPIDGDFFLMPANFLIGPPNFTVYLARYAETFADQLPFEEIETFLHK